MNELKTLKDLEELGIAYNNHTVILPDKLKTEAIKWIKSNQKEIDDLRISAIHDLNYNNVFEITVLSSQIIWIMRFFNITYSELSKR